MPLQVTEDTPPDMLAGSMDLLVVLPNGRTVKMNVERSTPMMDLLVQAATLNKISPGGHVLQPLGEHGVLPYKPSTPIGALDTWTIQVVPKTKAQSTSIPKKAPLKPLNQQQPQPFEQTFRLQVHLPRNQLYVMRVSPRTLLSDVLQQTCREKNLDPSKYEMRHPANLSQLLSPACTLADYGLQEVTVVARSGLGSSDIMALQREEDKRRQQARQQHGGSGVAIVLNKHSHSNMCEGSVSSDSLGGRSISPARSDESASRSASPPAPSLPPMMAPPPARPARKRRPAPKPPGPPEANHQAEASNNNNVPVSHSRNSSDSSGYHEASVLSDSPPEVQHLPDSSAPDTLPRRAKQIVAQAKSQVGLSRSMSSLTSCQHNTSSSSLASSTGLGHKKKKAPPPPPLNKTTSLERHMSGKTHTQLPDKSSTLPGKMKMLYECRTPSPEVNIPEEVPPLTTSPQITTENDRKNAPETFMSPSLETRTVENHRPPSPEVKKAKFEGTPQEVKTMENFRAASPEVKAVEPLKSTLQEVNTVESFRTTSSDTFRVISPELMTVETSRTSSENFRAPSPEIQTVESFRNSRENFRAPSPEIQTVESFRNSRENFRSPSPEVKTVDSFGTSDNFRTPSPEINVAESFRKPSENFRPPSPEIETIEPFRTESLETFRTASPKVESFSTSSSEPFSRVKTVEEKASETPPCKEASNMEHASALDQVEEAFRSVTAELEAAIQRDMLPPPPTLADDPAVDWEYQLPAPPSAFRDAESPTSSVALSDAHAFTEPSVSPEPQVNEVTRSNPLFVPQEFEDDESSRVVVPPAKQSRSGPNFTITTYQRPCVTEDIFREEVTNSLQRHQKFGSTSALHSLSRTDSFSNENINTFKQPGAPASVKRSTSYVSLIANPTPRTGKVFQTSENRTKSVGNLTQQGELQPAEPPLQSLQVLRSILPQLSGINAEDSVSKSIKQSNESQRQVNDEKPATVEPKRYVYRGPPAVNFTTWSERPKSQVSIKMDGDYRIGVGQGGHSEASEQKQKSAEVIPLTMHLVSHTTAQSTETKEVGLSKPSDPSRVPVVCAVELKKSFVQQQSANKSCTLLNGTDQRNEQFLGVNSLAKRFSGPSSNRFQISRPLSAYGKIESIEPESFAKPVNNSDIKPVPLKPNNIESVVKKPGKIEGPASARKVDTTDSRAPSRRYTSVVGINSEPDTNLSSSSFRGSSVVRVNGFTAPKQLMPVVKGFQFAAPAANRDTAPNKVQRSESTRTWKTDSTSFGSNEPPPPPPPLITTALKKSAARPRPKTLPAEPVNPRDQLMDAIRNFGRENLRQVSNTRDNVVLIR